MICIRTQRNIYKRKDGRWEGRYFKEYGADGKRKYSSVYGKTYTEVKEKLNKIKSGILNNPKSSEKFIKIKLKDVCYEWLESIKINVKASTYARYLYVIEKYIIPCVRNIKLYETDNNFTDVFIQKYSRLSSKTLKDILSIFKSIIAFVNEQYNINIQLKMQVKKQKHRESPIKGGFSRCLYSSIVI